MLGYKACSYNMLDVEISRAAWKGRDGSSVRQYAGRHAKQLASPLREDAARVLRAATNLEVHADAAARAIAKFRAVFTGSETEREAARARLSAIFVYMQEQELGTAKSLASGWPYFRKRMWSELPASARKFVLGMQVPIFSCQPMPQLNETVRDVDAKPRQAKTEVMEKAGQPEACSRDDGTGGEALLGARTSREGQREWQRQRCKQGGRDLETRSMLLLRRPKRTRMKRYRGRL